MELRNRFFHNLRELQVWLQKLENNSIRNLKIISLSSLEVNIYI